MSDRLIAKDADRSVYLSDLGIERIEYVERHDPTPST